MVTVRLDIVEAEFFQSGSGPHAGSLVGDPATLLRDESDSTYGETWMYLTSAFGIPYNSQVFGVLDLLEADPMTVTDIVLHMRFSTANELNAAQGRVRTVIYTAENDFITGFGADGNFSTGTGGTLENRGTATGGVPVTVVSPLTELEFDWYGIDMFGVAQALATPGTTLNINRYADHPTLPPAYPASFEMKVYEAWLEVTYVPALGRLKILTEDGWKFASKGRA